MSFNNRQSLPATKRLRSGETHKCARCRNHGNTVNVGKNKIFCPNKRCVCNLCKLSELTWQVMSKQVALRRKQDNTKGMQTVSYWSIDSSEGNLSQDFCKLLHTDVNHDVEMKCGEKSVMAHKFILCARSEVFKAMLQTDMLEGRTGIVEIEDIDFNCLQDFVLYLYTDELPQLTFIRAKTLFIIGDKYAVKSLVHRCSEYLLHNLSPENIFEVATLDDAFYEQKLKDGIITYILNEKMHLKEEIWAPFSKMFPKIDIEVLKLPFSVFCKHKVNKCVQTELLWNVDESQGSLSKDLFNMLNMDVNHDVEIKSGEHSIKAHVLVLCARSDVFKSMLQNNIQEGQSRVVEIKEANLNDLQDFVNFLYTDVLLDLTSEQARVLYEFGKTYDVRSLMHRCSRYLLDN